MQNNSGSIWSAGSYRGRGIEVRIFPEHLIQGFHAPGADRQTASRIAPVAGIEETAAARIRKNHCHFISFSCIARAIHMKR